jgi:Kef-type K+ transport system membrane component KefB
VTAVALLLAAAAIGFGVARWLAVPAIPLLLLAGVILGGVARLPPEPLQDAVLLGVTFLVFVAGLELDPGRVGEQRQAALRVGMAQFTALAMAGLIASLILGFPLEASLYLALALAASSTLVVVRLLKQRQELFEPFARLVIGVLLLQDVLVILLVPVVTRLPEGAASMALGLIAALGMVALAYSTQRWLSRRLIRWLGDDDELLLIGVSALLFLFIGLADLLRLPLVAGAFLAGVALSTFPVSGAVRARLLPLSDFFTAILFAALGALLVLPTLIELAQALALALLVVLLTPLLVTVVAERSGLSARPALESGLLLAQTSEFSLVVGLHGLMVAQIAPPVFTIIVLVTVLTMVATPFVTTNRVVWWLLRFHPLRRAPSELPHLRDHVLLLGCGDNGMPLLETLLYAGHQVVVVDDDPTVIERLRDGEVPCIRGDGSDFDILRRAGARHARVIISTVRRDSDNLPVLDYARGVPVLVRVFDPAAAERIHEQGGIPVLYSQAAAQEFMRWFEQLSIGSTASSTAG